MNACNRLRSSLLYTSILTALAATACTVKSDDQGEANARVNKVVVVGTSVTSALYASGDLGLTTIPQDAASQPVLDGKLNVDIRITSPAEIATTVGTTECTVPDQNDKAVAIGMIIDDSGSMFSSDPNNMRKAASISFLGTLGANDKVLLTDYGATGDHLRDLLCLSQLASGASEDTCSPPRAAFSADKAALVKAAERIDASGGTPLFESCVEMMPLVDSVKDGRRGVLLLSDGEPNSDTKRDECHAAAKAAQIPVFTVGLGPAAEGAIDADPAAVKVLRELATDTGGSYASANDAAQLDSLFRSVGTALARGSCKTTATLADAATKIQPGMKVSGEVTIGSNGAKATFEFVAPEKQ
ncbi:MAG: hypothetical protein JWO86_5989 [Myxococcaceae bacterium]|jgi:hypothetical protein|nr:hypothetical protein [Myxococcaceae bacterium]MEA2752546.1 Ca-activated chloride channel [Myxococcales bacterium]